jgi:poly(3-hydroxybutyrate) depolymerase
MSSVAVSLVWGVWAEREPPPPLPALSISADRVAVAGLSSGAYMATQAHLAWGERIDAVALVAGGPYHCARGDLQRALGECMKADPAPPDVEALAAAVRARAQGGAVAPLDALAGDRVWILHGSDDPIVAPALAGSAADLYLALARGQDLPISVTVDVDRRFGHSFPTLETGAACGASVSPFLGACGFDAAGEIFQALFGAPVGEPGDAGGSLHRFHQRPYAAADADPLLADEGFLYVPAACAAGAACGLLTVFHGCDQSAEKVGDAFVRGAGFDRWADAYQVVVLYPQTRATYMPLNPKGCWDWWGYTGSEYDTRRGAQLRWLDAAMTALGVPSR